MSLPPWPKTWISDVLATVGVPPTTAIAPPLTRIRPAASRLTVIELLAAVADHGQHAALNVAVVAAFAGTLVDRQGAGGEHAAGEQPARRTTPALGSCVHRYSLRGDWEHAPQTPLASRKFPEQLAESRLPAAAPAARIVGMTDRRMRAGGGFFGAHATSAVPTVLAAGSAAGKPHSAGCCGNFPHAKASLPADKACPQAAGKE